MTAMLTVPVQVETRGKVPAGMTELAAAKVGSVLRHAAEPVLFARVTLTMATDPAVTRPAVARVNVDMNGRPIRARAAGGIMREAIDRLTDRLRVRVDRARDWAVLHGTRPDGKPGEWRHQSIPAHRAAYFPRPQAERSVIRRASRAAGPLTPAEAVAELNLLGYDFHLFTERSTGRDSVIYRSGDGYRLAQIRPQRKRLGQVPDSVTLSEQPAPRLTVEDAITRLESLGQPFAFFAEAGTGRGNVIYHRYDGHYGLVVPPAAE